MRLPLGKVPLDILEKYVLGTLGYESPDVVLGPGVGVDFAVLRLNGGYLIVSADPVTGVEEDIGWYAVNVSANDVATSGARPRFLTSVILLPEGCGSSQVEEIGQQIGGAARELGIAVVAGHTEVTPRLTRPIVVATAFTVAERYVTSRGAREGDFIIMTKTAGIEGTSILARSLKDRLKPLGEETVRRAQGMVKQISIVKDATLLYSTGVVHAMHDPTEGGVLGGLYEMALSSNLGFRIHVNDIPVAEETLKICGILNIDPSKLIGSGCLLAAVDPAGVDDALRMLREEGIRGTVLGVFTKEGRMAVRPDGSVQKVGEVTDELWRVLDTSTGL